MTKQYDNLDDVFNISSEIVSSQKEEKIQNLPIEKIIENKTIISDVRKDYEYARGNMYSIIEKGQEALNGILELAQETESPRAYEVVGQLIKNVSDSTEKLIELQKKLKDLEEIKTSSGPTSVTNALFVGSTTELSKLLKGRLNNKEDK